MCGKPIGAVCWIGGVVLLSSGCQSPLDGNVSADQSLRRSVEDAVKRELETAAGENEPYSVAAADAIRHRTTQPPSDVEETLAERRDELEQIGPMMRVEDPAELGPDLNAQVQQGISITLKDAIRSSVANNLRVQEARLQPAISSADVVAAEAVFDAVFFASADLRWTDQPTAVPIIAGNPVAAPVSNQTNYRFDTGIRKPLTTGGEVSVTTQLNRNENSSPGVTLFPDPAYGSEIRLGLTQPLLRGFGSDVNTSVIRIARNQERRSIELLRADLLAAVEQTELAYWNLVFSWHELAIRQWLVEVGIEVREVLARRREFDTRLAQYSDAVATVEQRKADVIRAQRLIRAASDALKVLINDPDVTIGSELIYLPVDKMVDAPISYSLLDAVLTAVSLRPDIQQAVLDIDDASIRQLVADNSRLPLLDLTAEVAWTGLDDSGDGSYDNLTDGDFVDYVLALLFETPIGNRAAQAQFRRARLERSASVIRYRRAIQDAVADVKSDLRDVVANYELIKATRDNRVAQAENLRALQVEEETLASLTPEFLNLKFQRQDRLGLARREEVLALVNFDQSVAALYRSMGIGLDMNGIELEIVGEHDEIGAPSGNVGVTPVPGEEDAATP